MDFFNFYNPVNIIFGRGGIRSLAELVPTDGPILITYGQGSARTNGVREQVMAALGDRTCQEFWGIEPNPRYETLMQAVVQAKVAQSAFLLAVGGGSVIDGTKFIAAAAADDQGDPWEMLAMKRPARRALPLGVVLTLPAAGSEANGFAVISREADRQKLPMASPLLFPRFAIIDPETTYSLPARQIANGVVDAFVHVLEQYLTYPQEAPLQDRQAEAILLTLLAEGPKTLADPRNYAARANLCWCASQALNGLISCGLVQDWSTHMIGHELTALYGIDHGQSLAAVLFGVLQVQRAAKRAKLIHYGRRVWGLEEADEELVVDSAIQKTSHFFQSLGVPTTLRDHGIGREAADLVAARLAERGVRLGEHGDLDADQVRSIVLAAWS